MKTSRRILITVMSLLLVLSCLPAVTLAADDPFAAQDAANRAAAAQITQSEESAGSISAAAEPYDGPRAMVRFKDSVPLTDIKDMLSGYDYELPAQSSERMFILHAEAAELDFGDTTEFIEEDGEVEAEAIKPNDTQLSRQWAINAMKLPDAWTITRGSNNIYVAVIDSGVNRSHPDLPQSRITIGRDYVSGGSVTGDPKGHGTMVTGVLAASTNNSMGMAGGCWYASIVPLRVLDSAGRGSNANVVSAIYAAADAGCDVINMSLGGTGTSSAMQAAVTYAAKKGCIVVAAAGNDGNSGYNYPASCDNVVSAGAVTSKLTRASFSNYNNRVDVAAPGAYIYTTTGSSGYSYVDGTSFASPYVASVAALAKARKKTLTNDGFMSLIKKTSTDKGKSGYDVQFGFGLINAYKLLAAVAPAKAPTSPSAKALSTGVNVKWTLPSGVTGVQVYRKAGANGTYARYYTAGRISSMLDTGVTAGVTYYYRIRSYVKSGGTTEYSAFGKEVYAKSTKTLMPGKPASFAGKATDEGVKLSWTLPASGGSYNIVQIQRRTVDGTYAVLKNLGKVTSYTDTDVQSGVTYLYRVRCVRSTSKPAIGGSFAASIKVTANSGGPAVPTGFSAQYNEAGGCVRLSWNTSAGADYYDIIRSDGSGYSTLAQTINATYADNSAQSGKTYSYAVRAVGAGKESSYCTPVSVVIPDIDRPDAPTVDNAANYGSTALLYYTMPGDCSNLKLTRYRKSSGSTFSVDTTLTSYGLTPGSSYRRKQTLSYGYIYRYGLKSFASDENICSDEACSGSISVYNPSVAAPTVISVVNGGTGVLKIKYTVPSGVNKVFFNIERTGRYNEYFVSGLTSGVTYTTTISGLVSGYNYSVSMASVGASQNSALTSAMYCSCEEGQEPAEEPDGVEAPAELINEGVILDD